MRVLVVEDSERLRKAVTEALRRSGYAVDEVGDGEAGLHYVLAGVYDVVVLDLMLPGVDGMTILKRMRKSGKKAGVLILTAKDAVGDRVEGLKSGADDYLIKPFALEELLARVQSVGRRAQSAGAGTVVKVGDLEIDTGARSVRRAGKMIDLSAREYGLLEFLALKKGAVVSRSEIEERLYAETKEVMSNVVDSAVCALRRKIDVYGSESVIRTRRGMGYVLGEEQEVKSIRVKLAAGLVGAILAVAATAGVVLVWMVDHRVTEDFDRALASKARSMSGIVKRNDKGGLEVDYAEEKMEEYGAQKRAEFFEVWGEDGRVVEKSASLMGKDLKRAGEVAEKVVLPDGKEGRAISMTYVPEADEEDAKAGLKTIKVTLTVARGTKSIERVREIVGWGVATAALVLAAGGAGVVWVLVGKGLAPLAAVGKQAAAMDAGSLGTKFGTADLPTELLPIVNGLNELLARLESAFERERRFTSAAAHELRTPIAELKAMAEVAIRWPGSAGGGMEEVLAVAKNMEAVAGSLLALSRCQAGELEMRREKVDVAKVARQVWEGEAGLLQVAGTQVVEGDPGVIEAVVRNLLENAREYGVAHEVVRCDLGEGKFKVTNAQVGMTEEDAKHVFEPFWRKDKARTGGVHVGLGLALVRAYVGAIGGSVGARLDGRDFIVEVKWS